MSWAAADFSWKKHTRMPEGILHHGSGTEVSGPTLQSPTALEHMRKGEGAMGRVGMQKPMVAFTETAHLTKVNTCQKRVARRVADDTGKQLLDPGSRRARISRSWAYLCHYEGITQIVKGLWMRTRIPR